MSSSIPVHTTSGAKSKDIVTWFIVNTVSTTKLIAIQSKISGTTLYINNFVGQFMIESNLVFVLGLCKFNQWAFEISEQSVY